MFRRLTARVVAYLNKKRAAPQRVEVSPDTRGITVNWSDSAGVAGQRSIAWGEISRIVVFKRDLYAHDVICMLIESRNKSVFELDETTPGWERLISALSDYMPSVTPFEEWSVKVAFPAFEASPVTIYTQCA